MVSGRYNVAPMAGGQYDCVNNAATCAIEWTRALSTMIGLSSYANPLGRLAAEAANASMATPTAGSQRVQRPLLSLTHDDERSGRGQSLRRLEVVSQDVPDRGQPVLPADLFPLGVRATRVAD